VTLSEEVRAHCAQVTGSARWVRIDDERLASLDGWAEEAAAPELDPDRHFVEGSREDVAAYLLTLTAINFGSGWFPLLRKRRVDGRPVSGYFTVAMGLTDRFRAHGAWTPEQLRRITTPEIAAVLGQSADLELMSLFAQALRQLGGFLGTRTPLQVVESAGGSAQALAATVGRGMTMWADRGFYKRAQILPNDLAMAGVAEFSDLDSLTIFADNLVPHVLRCEGVLVYDDELAARIDSEQLLENAEQEHEIRAAAVHACAHLSQRLGVPERVLDTWLWSRGQAPEFKARPRHRARSVFY
jgi:hypothetical protein